jgi:probable HAF family extracellular repeat protein
LSETVLVWLALAFQSEAASFQGLGRLPGGEAYSAARAVSADGSTVVGTSGSASGFREAFRWTEAGGIRGLGDLAGGEFFSDAYAVSRNGSVIVGESVSASGTEAFRWMQTTGMRGLGDLPGPEFSSRAMGVSADGLAVVGTGDYSPGGGPHPVTGEAFRWTESSGLVALGDVPGGSGASRALAVSAGGSVIVGKGDAGASFQAEDLGVAFRWSAQEGMTRLGFLPGGSGLSAATAVSEDGAVIVGHSLTASNQEAFRWTAQGGMVSLGSLLLPGGSYQSMASAVSADGSVVVGWCISPLEEAAFIWDQTGGLRNLQEVLSEDLGLDLTGWRLSSASGISADGTVIIGTGSNPASQHEAWRAVVPELYRPLLSAALTPDGDGVRLSWSARFHGFQLQEAQDLRLPQWTAVSGQAEVQNGQYVIELPLSVTRFYRLAR